MKKANILLTAVVLMLMVPCVTAQTKSTTERFLLRGNTPIQVSVETGWARDGLTPVILDIDGVSLSLYMDAEGRVGDEMMFDISPDGKSALRGIEYFRLNVEEAKLVNRDRALAGQAYERNKLRTRFRLNVPAALELNVTGHRATLDLGDFEIPVRAHCGPETNGIRKVDLGEPGNRGDVQLFLDVKQGRLMAASSRPGRLRMKDAAGGECWAEKPKEK